jgi:hypothetical protein
MVHKCKVQCHTVNPTDMDLLGIKEDEGKWLPFAIDLGVINAMKMSTDEKGESTYKCTTIFCTDGNTFILDTPYEELLDKWSTYVNTMWEEEDSSDDDITL